MQWVPFDTGHKPYSYRAVVFADVIDIAMRELPIDDVPKQLRVEATAERKRAQAEDFNKRMNIATCKAVPSQLSATPSSWRSYLPGYVK